MRTLFFIFLYAHHSLQALAGIACSTTADCPDGEECKCIEETRQVSKARIPGWSMLALPFMLLPGAIAGRTDCTCQPPKGISSVSQPPKGISSVQFLQSGSSTSARRQSSETPTPWPSLRELLDENLVLRDTSKVLLGCVGPNCDGDEGMLGRKFDMRVAFVQHIDDISNKVFDDQNYLWWFSWNLCRHGFRPEPQCKWRDIANGAYDQQYIIPAAEYLKDTLKSPIVLGIVNEMMGIYGNESSYGLACEMVECPADYLAMYYHIQQVFKDHGVTEQHVIWGWSTFNRPVVVPESGKPLDQCVQGDLLWKKSEGKTGPTYLIRRISRSGGKLQFVVVNLDGFGVETLKEEDVESAGKPGFSLWERYYPGDDHVKWVGINAFTGYEPGPWESIEEIYDHFYKWVSHHDLTKIIPVFHAFATHTNPNDVNAKADFWSQLPSLLGPGGKFSKIKAAIYYGGDSPTSTANIRTEPENEDAIRNAFNADIFGGFHRLCKDWCLANTTAPWDTKCPQADCEGCFACHKPCKNYCPQSTSKITGVADGWSRSCYRQGGSECCGCPQCMRNGHGDCR